MATIREGILARLASGPKTISELYEGIAGKRTSIDKACFRLVKSGESERVDRGISAKKRVAWRAGAGQNFLEKFECGR